jgi:hypothetical protein
VKRADFISSENRGFCISGGLQRMLGDGNDCIHGGVDGLDAIEVCLDDFDRRDLARADQFGQRGGV